MITEFLKNFPAWPNAVAFMAVVASFAVRGWCDRKGYPYPRYTVASWPIVLTGAGLVLIFFWIQANPDTPLVGGRFLIFLHELSFVHFNRGPLEHAGLLAYWALKTHVEKLYRLLHR